MKTETMTPQWIVENFLPDYENKYQEEVGQYYDEDFGFAPGNKSLPDRFERKHFPEALSEILKAQRDECYESWHSAIAEKGEPYYESIATAIRNSPIPEPKNRK